MPREHRDLVESMRWAKDTTVLFDVDVYLLKNQEIDFTESDLLRELAWVILCSGFRERVVRKHFTNISLCFLDWSSSKEINKNSHMCVSTALDVFGSRRKIAAIARAAEKIEDEGFPLLKRRIESNPIKTLQEFPFIGEITAFHVAKNIGFDVAKPDRHLVRLASKYGYRDVHTFCSTIAQKTGYPVRVIDTLLWRVSELGLTDALKFDSISINRPASYGVSLSKLPARIVRRVTKAFGVLRPLATQIFGLFMVSLR